MLVVEGLQAFYDLRVLRGNVCGLANVSHRVTSMAVLIIAIEATDLAKKNGPLPEGKRTVCT